MIPELLMPAGDLEKAKIAYQYGADACYGSTSAFSMRTREIGFDYKTLKEAIDYAHSIDKKFYVTLNTYPHEFELTKIKTHAKKLISMQPDAIIVADTGILQIATKELKNRRTKKHKMELHLSTQANATNSEAIKFWAKQDISRIILARELSIKEIAEIRRKTPKKIVLESFVHGAMCNSVSGRCNLSNYLSYRDANRGACVQACRWKFALVEEKRPNQFIPVEEDNDGSYIYNSRDLCMIEYLDELTKAGISSFKVEGRNKSIYYCAIVSRAYRKAIDLLPLVIASRNDEAISIDKKIATRPARTEWLAITRQKELKKLRRELNTVTNRGYSTGFYFGKPTDADINYETSRPSSDWQFVGIVLDVIARSGFATKQSGEKIAAPPGKPEMARNDKEYLIEARNEIKPGTTVEIVTPEKIYKTKLNNFTSPKGIVIDKPNPNSLFVLNSLHNLPINTFLRAKK
jgi:putative protease